MKFINIFFVLAFMLSFSSCLDDLDVEPEVQQTLGNLLESDPDAATGIVARLYGGLVLHGTGVPGGADQQADIAGDDPGETVYLRNLWNLQEVTTDVVKNRWGDNGLDPLTLGNNWTASNKFFGYMYNRIFFQVSQVNNFILELEEFDVPNEETLRAEARFLRALSYYHGVDLFGSIPLVTEADGIGGANKPNASRQELFNYVESELQAVISALPETNEYGRANKDVARMTLAKLYLNAEVYIGENRYSDALDLVSTIINGGRYQLDDDYQSIFQGDNFTSPEIIFPLLGDRDRIQSFGNTTYLINGSYSTETMPIEEFGASQGWVGHRCTEALVNKFDGGDQRAIFWTEGHTLEMEDYREWTNGYPTTKFRNSYAEGEAPAMAFSDVDFPLYRLADAYLMYAECVVRGGGGDVATAVSYVNALRQRAYGDESGNISESDLTLDFIIDERARELYYEAHRRQDLIRFGLYLGNDYLWPWKGGLPIGTAMNANYNIFPLPTEALQANPNLEQNPGY